MVRLAIEAPNDFAIDQWAIGWRKSRNYVVAPLEAWESPETTLPTAQGFLRALEFNPQGPAVPETLG